MDPVFVKSEKSRNTTFSLDTAVSEVSFVALDLETTGSTPPDDRIIEIGARYVRDFKLGPSYQKLVNPMRGLPPFITRLTGIAITDLETEDPLENVLPEFLDFLDDSVIVAHFATFDHKFLRMEARKTLGVSITNPVLCTCKLARRILHFLPSKGLDAVTHFLGIHVNGRHRAFGDADATAKILVVFLHYLEDKGITTLGELLQFQEASPHAAHRKSAARY